MAYIVKRSYFTLLEILVVLFIISFSVILTGVKVKEIYQEQRFLSETGQVLSHLSMAQDLMLITDSDVVVKIAFNPAGKLQVWLEVEKPFDGPWARFVERKLTLNAIQSYEFEEKPGKRESLLFSLGKMSQGTLSLYESKKDEKREFHIELVGYPKLLKGVYVEEGKLSKKVEKRMMREKSQIEKSKALYPTEVFDKIYAKPNQEKAIL